MAATVQTVQSGQRAVDILATGAVAQASTATYVTVAGTDMDARAWRSAAYTIAVATNDVTWQVLGANTSDYSDAVVVQAGASVVAGANSSYAANPAPYGFYRVQIKDTSGGTHGTATVSGMAKGI
jgi:hypothetical protein